ncbi:hypothetical protein, partial [Flavobacterium sp.]|uniref:hypothetical protein n=1 Tax=Flavobacterium sp. TaxID=239 RepID=UPI002B4B854A
MKKITLFIAFAFLFILKSNAQVSSYSFAQSNGSYSEFTDGTVLGTATGNAVGAPSLDSEVYMVTLPFSFIFNGASYSSCYVSSNGYITFGATAPTTGLATPISNTAAYNGSISAWGGDLNALFELGGLTGDMQWKEIGTAPNRELVFQYRSFRPAYATSTTLAPYINFQIRLSETTNEIKFVYGSSGLAVGTTNSSTTKQIGLRGATNTDFNNRTNATTVLFTASTSGTLNTNTQAYSSVNATPGVPSNGLTYTWTPPTCLAPLSTEVSNITTTTATISWLATATVPSGGYEYYYSTSNVVPTGAGTSTSNLTENLTGLSDSSNYFLWIRSNCGSGNFSAWVGPVSFATTCVSATSFSQNFDGVAASTFPVCWGKVGTTGSANLQTTNPSSAPNTLYMYSTSATTKAVVKTLPVSNLGAGTHRLKMQMRGNSSIGGVIEIGYLTDVADAASFVSLGSVIAASLAYQEYSFVPAAGTYTDNLALRHTGAPAYSVLIDDVVWETIPAVVPNCSVVSTPVNGSTNQNVATNLTWSVNGIASGYKLSIGTTSGGTDILNNVDLGNVTSYNPPINFAPNTLYFLYLIAYNVTGDATGCTETSFTTSVP